MADKAQAKASAVSAKAGGTEVLTMFTIKGDPIKALSRFKLPAGAHVAIVSENPQSVSAIRKSVRGRVARVTSDGGVMLGPCRAAPEAGREAGVGHTLPARPGASGTA